MTRQIPPALAAAADRLAAARGLEGDLPKAQARLAALAGACASSGAQDMPLRDAIARDQADGDRYAASGKGG